jgi:hypothetical protein
LRGLETEKDLLALVRMRLKKQTGSNSSQC